MFKKIHSKKGFTLAELLIVVAIIAVLTAIAIPVFSSQLEKAKISADKANVRSWYAEQVVKYLDEQTAFPTAYAGETLQAGGATCTCATDATSGVWTVTYSNTKGDGLVLKTEH